MHVAICHESLARSFVHSFARSLALLATLVRSLSHSLMGVWRRYERASYVDVKKRIHPTVCVGWIPEPRPQLPTVPGLDSTRCLICDAPPFLVKAPLNSRFVLPVCDSDFISVFR